VMKFSPSLYLLYSSEPDMFLRFFFD
jgi:hypothetical protein